MSTSRDWSLAQMAKVRRGVRELAMRVAVPPLALTSELDRLHRRAKNCLDFLCDCPSACEIHPDGCPNCHNTNRLELSP